MSQLIKVAGWSAGVRLNVVFVHGLGGSTYGTWRRSKLGSTFWPEWLARDIPGVAAWTLSYEASPTNWIGTAMPVQDRAKNVLESLLGCRELTGTQKYNLVYSAAQRGNIIQNVPGAERFVAEMPGTSPNSFINAWNAAMTNALYDLPGAPR